MVSRHFNLILNNNFKLSYFKTFVRKCGYPGSSTSSFKSFSLRPSLNCRGYSPSLMNDRVHIENLRVDAVIGPDSWNQLSPQQCFVTLDMHTDFSKAAEGDDLNYTLNYAVISRDVENFVNSKKNWRSLGGLTRSVANYTLEKYRGIERLQLKTETKTGHIRSDSITCLVDNDRHSVDESQESYDLMKISNLKLLTLIGVFTFERLQKQFITLDIRLPWLKNSKNDISYKSVIEDTVEYVEKSNFLTVEALVESIVKIIASNPYYKDHCHLPIEVKVIKLNAITSTSGVGVSSIKKPVDLESLELPQQLEEITLSHNNSLSLSLDKRAEIKIQEGWNIAFIAFGSNMGDKFRNICTALNHLRANKYIRAPKVSSLFESEPMYYKDQDVFMNGCVQIETKLSPSDLLRLCKEIEYEELGRVKHFDNCPRVVDLDIIMYLNGNGENLILDTKDLTIPHPRMLERSFVLEPLCELVSPEFTHPLTTESLVDHLNQIYSKQNQEDILWKVIPLPSDDSVSRHLKFKRGKATTDPLFNSQAINQSSTLLMGIINATPDSFSDGDTKYLDVNYHLQTIKHMCADSLHLQKRLIIDIGGCSTRPNSVQATEEEELKRTIPIIKAIKECEDLPQDKIAISIDTYRSAVAREAILAGADIVNDISGGSFDNRMFDVIAAHPDVAYALSHIRGDISNMVKMNAYEDSSTAVKEFINGEECHSKNTVLIRSIGRELSERYAEAVSKGIARWQIILDPGIGFAKNGKQNLEIIRQLPLLKNYSCILPSGEFVNFSNIPILVGPSRKGFIGRITKDDDPKDRDFATGSIIASCIGLGADLVRAHNVKDCSKTVKIADALYKNV